MTRSFRTGQRLLVIENIPCLFCSQCGERYFTATTLREIERIKGRGSSLIRRKPMRVVAFGAA